MTSNESYNDNMHRCMRQATPLGPQGRPGKRPSSSDLNRAFNNLGPPPRIPSALSEETLSEIAPSPKSSFASVEPPKDHEKQAPTSWNNVVSRKLPHQIKHDH